MRVTHIPAITWTGRNDPEDGEDALRVHHFAAQDGARALIGFACEAGVLRNKGRGGASLGPAAVRAALSGLSAPNSARAFVDLGDVGVEGDALEAGQTLLAEAISNALKTQARVVAIGGGHETAFASFRGLRGAFGDQKIGIINFDAHLDIRNIGAGGSSSGTPFNQIRALAPQQFDYLCIGVAEESNTQALLNRAANWGVRTVSDHALQVDSHAADAEISAMAARCDAIYLTVDLDVLPHFQAPGVSAPAVRGVAFSKLERMVQRVLDEARSVPVCDVVELSPPHDVQGMTARSAAYLVRRMLFS